MEPQPMGAVVTTVAEYAAIRPLLAPLFDIIVAEGRLLPPIP
jgi:hypothetical protein